VHQPVVADPVEVALQVDVYHPTFPCGDELLRRPHRVMRAASGPESITVLAEVRFPYRTELLVDGLLDQSIQHRRNAERAHTSACLGDFYGAHRLGRVTPGQ